MAVAADEVGGKLKDTEISENRDLFQELQVLKEIYITELSINLDASGHFTSIDVQLHPSTGENVSQKWVCLTLQLIPPPDYPHSVPEICIRGPRGLADEHVASMKKSLNQIAEDRKGEPMMYELIESAKESLTQMNVPYGQCMICLDDFSGSRKEFTKTDCYHYFHCGCLSLYVNHCKTEFEAPKPSNTFTETEVNEEIVCPVCRVKLLPSDLDLSTFQQESGAEILEGGYTPSEEMRELQRMMADLFDKQKQKGGIIDLDEERNKYLLPKDFVYVGSVEESRQDTPLFDTVQAVSSVLQENNKTSRTPQHQRQRDRGGRQGNRGTREHERGGRGARVNRREYASEQSEFGRESAEYCDDRVKYSRKRGEYGREREYGKERSTYARERRYRGPRQEEKRGALQNEEGSRSNRNHKFYDQMKPGDACSVASETQNETVSKKNGSTEKMEQIVEAEQRNESENSRPGSSDALGNQVQDGGSAKLDEPRKVEDLELQGTTKNSRQIDIPVHGREAPSKKSGNFVRRDRRQEHDHYNRRDEEEFPRRHMQKSQHRGERHQDFRLKGSDDGKHSKHRSEMLNFSEQNVKEIEPSQKEMINDKKLEDTTDVAVTSSCQGNSELASSDSNRKSIESDNHYRWQRHQRRDRDQKQYQDGRSLNKSTNKAEMLIAKTSDEGRDALKDEGSGMASTDPDQPKDLADGQLPENKIPSLNSNDTTIPDLNRTSGQGQSVKHENHFKSRPHARGNTVKAYHTSDRRERSAGTDEIRREHFHKDFQSKPKTTIQETRECPGKTIIPRNYKNPQRSEARSRPKEGRQLNDRQKFQKDAHLEAVKDLNDISESRSAENKCPTYDKPRSPRDAINPKSNLSDKSAEVHPGFCIRSISTVNTELCKTLDS